MKPEVSVSVRLFFNERRFGHAYFEFAVRPTGSFLINCSDPQENGSDFEDVGN